MNEVIDLASRDVASRNLDIQDYVPPPMCSQYSRPTIQEAVAEHFSRLGPRP